MESDTEHWLFVSYRHQPDISSVDWFLFFCETSRHTFIASVPLYEEKFSYLVYLVQFEWIVTGKGIREAQQMVQGSNCFRWF